mgnify:CR=1 FL=1
MLGSVLAPQNLFSRLTKYRGLYKADPGEDRLTEALAALLESVNPALAVHLVSTWLTVDESSVKSGFGERPGKGPHLQVRGLEQVDDVKVLTQVPFQERYVDLEIEFRGAEGFLDHLPRVRVELKKGTPLHGGQVKHYEDRDPVLDVPRVPVVILAPAYQLPFENMEEAPESAPQCSWQHTYALIDEFVFPLDQEDRKRHEWLKEQFCEYLEEEGLKPMKRLSERHLSALGVLDEAQGGLQEMVSIALKELDFEESGSLGRSRIGGGSWWHYRIGVDLPPGVWAEFKVSEEKFGSRNLEARPGIKFIAGLSWKGNTSPEELSEELASSIEASGFHHFSDGGCGRLMRVFFPDDPELENAPTLEAQGSVLSNWISESFEQASDEVRRLT